MTDCRHPNRPHTLWWWDDRDAAHMPAPMSVTYDGRADAVSAAEIITADPPPGLHWVKVFRADNEVYTCWRWNRPTVPNCVTPGQVPALTSAMPGGPTGRVRSFLRRVSGRP